jgi:molecular chaperone GrpE
VAKPSDEFRPADADQVLSDFQSPEETGAAAHAEGQDTDSTIDRLRRELDQANDRALRAQADLENFRRRLQREMQDERRFANQPLLIDLLPVLDNMERAIEAAQQSAENARLLEGFQMVHNQLLTALEKYHCTRVPAEGQVFDPALHQALVQMPSPDVEAGRILHVNQHGYQLHGRVIRPAQVVVSSGNQSANANPQ